MADIIPVSPITDLFEPRRLCRNRQNCAEEPEQRNHEAGRKADDLRVPAIHEAVLSFIGGEGRRVPKGSAREGGLLVGLEEVRRPFAGTRRAGARALLRGVGEHALDSVLLGAGPVGAGVGGVEGEGDWAGITVEGGAGKARRRIAAEGPDAGEEVRLAWVDGLGARAASCTEDVEGAAGSAARGAGCGGAAGGEVHGGGNLAGVQRAAREDAWCDTVVAGVVAASPAGYRKVRDERGG